MATVICRSKRICMCPFQSFWSSAVGTWPTGVFFMLTAHGKGFLQIYILLGLADQKQLNTPNTSQTLMVS
uniref:Uncharacterized protein n=1 Tax=Anguilla anguilla TaxID=7936 RepID=A0A0E9VRT5_ANGAN